MDYDARLATRISRPVDRRLRMLAVLQNQGLGHLIDGLLDKVLPSAAELASRLSENRTEHETDAAEVAA